jgi:hypothetical protein
VAGRDERVVLEYEAICEKLKELGGMREPELAAALGWEEDRVYGALAEPLKLGWLQRDPASREVRLAAPLRARRYVCPSCWGHSGDVDGMLAGRRLCLCSLCGHRWSLRAPRKPA